MIRVIMGDRGTGKSRKMIEMANQSFKDTAGDVVFISSSKKHMYNLNYNIRFVDISEFDIYNYRMFYGFICGIISDNFDVSQIYIDDISEIKEKNDGSFQKFINDLKKLSDKFNISFTVTIIGEPESAPEYLKKCIVNL